MADTADHNLRQVMKSTADCLEPEALASFLDGEASISAATRKHVENCSNCQGELALMRSFLSGEVSAVEKPHVDAIVRRLQKTRLASNPGRFQWIWNPWTWGPAFAVAALGLIVMVNAGRQPTGDVRLRQGSEVMRSQTLHVEQPAGEMAQLPSTIKWDVVAGAVRYRVRMLEVDRTVIWETTTAGTEVAIPVSASTSIVPGRWMMLDVEALDAGGGAIAASGTVSFRVKPSQK